MAQFILTTLGCKKGQTKNFSQQLKSGELRRGLEAGKCCQQRITGIKKKNKNFLKPSGVLL